MTDIDGLLLRHLSGSASREDRDRLDRWLEDDPRTSAQLARLRAEDEAAESLFRTRRRRWHATPHGRVAMGVAVVIASVAALSTPLDPFVGPPIQAYATGVGQRSTILLGDGSTVVLGPRSAIRFPRAFPADGRDLALEGAAYFEVAPDAARPFRVRAAGTVTRALGTRFVIRAHDDEPVVEVAVAQGRVAVRDDEAAEADAVELTGGQIARIDARGVARITRDEDIGPILGWTAGRLAFRASPLDEIARELERWYDVEIHIADAQLGNRALTLSFEDAPLEEVLGAIAVSLNAQFRIADRTVTLLPTRPTP